MKRKRTIHRHIIGIGFAAPWLLGFFVWTLGPLLFSIVLSFMHWDGITTQDIQWVGFDNFRRCFQEQDFWLALSNTFYYSFIAIPLSLCYSLFLAVLLNQRVKGIGVFRTIFYLPHIIGGIATIVIWQWLYNPDFGMFNNVLRGIIDFLSIFIPSLSDMSLPGWIYERSWAKPSLIIMNMWGAGGAMLIFLAGLQNIPTYLYEAADIDGASRWQQFRHITIPQLSPTIFFNLVMGIIGSFQVFNQVFLMYNSSSGDSLLFYVLYLYRKAFEDFELGYASALAWILFIVIMFFTLLVIRSSKVWVHYEESG
ncbi:sugar ABC transporter permease [candidate division KSB1 bacterium]|nr:sugar ABC transporter permease [candidate division KSB1 bacterium]